MLVTNLETSARCRICWGNNLEAQVLLEAYLEAGAGWLVYLSLNLGQVV